MRMQQQGDLLSTDEAARFLGMTVYALQTLRVRGIGPKHVKVEGWFVRYPLPGLIAYKRGLVRTDARGYRHVQ